METIMTNPTTFKIADGNFAGIHIRDIEVPVVAFFSKFGLLWCVHENREHVLYRYHPGGDFISFEVSEYTTGRRLPFEWPHLNAESAIDEANKMLDKRGEKEVMKAIAEHKKINE